MIVNLLNLRRLEQGLNGFRATFFSGTKNLPLRLEVKETPELLRSQITQFTLPPHVLANDLDFTVLQEGAATISLIQNLCCLIAEIAQIQRIESITR